MNLLELESRLNPSQLTGPQLLDNLIPVFASLPEANHTIYLDFNGHDTINSSWNGAKYGSKIVTVPYDLDGSPNSFSFAEKEAITEIFARVKEDFIPFNVNVTTIEPPLSDLERSGVNDTRWGVRVAVGGNYSDWYGIAVAGVALPSSFGYPSDTPVYTFSLTLSNNTNWIAENMSHEVGHSLGLSHDGIPGNQYYSGHGSGLISWAPIMGGNYDKAVTQWSNGEYHPLATNKQDDLLFITDNTNNGFSYRQDDYIAPMLLDTSINGIIERNTDVDTFSFIAPKGQTQFSFDIKPALIGANLDIKAILTDANGTVLFVSAPAERIDASFSIVLGRGEYYLSITGDGSINYTNYASLGQYNISVNKTDFFNPAYGVNVDSLEF